MFRPLCPDGSCPGRRLHENGPKCPFGKSIVGVNVKAEENYIPNPFLIDYVGVTGLKFTCDTYGKYFFLTLMFFFTFR